MTISRGSCLERLDFLLFIVLPSLPTGGGVRLGHARPASVHQASPLDRSMPAEGHIGGLREQSGPVARAQEEVPPAARGGPGGWRDQRHGEEKTAEVRWAIGSWQAGAKRQPRHENAHQCDESSSLLSRDNSQCARTRVNFVTNTHMKAPTPLVLVSYFFKGDVRFCLSPPSLTPLDTCMHMLTPMPGTA